MTSFFNIRPLCFWAFFIVVALYAVSVNIWLAVAWIGVLIIGLGVCRFFGSKDKVLYFFGSSKIFFIGAVFLCFIVLLSYNITKISYDGARPFVGVKELSGVVESYNFRADDISLMTISGARFDGKAIDGRVIVFVDDYDKSEHRVETGRKVSFETKLSVQGAEAISVNSRTKYSASVSFHDIMVGERHKDLKHITWRYSQKMFDRWLSDGNADLMQSMVFGDKSTLDGEVARDFTTSGLIHALAVSGMNVGLIVGLLYLVLRAVRVRHKFQFPIILIVLVFYCYLCDWQESIIRATIMFMVILFNRIYLRRADLLSCLAFSVILTLVFMPFAYWSWSFRLSYACMFGIALFYQPMKKYLGAPVSIYLCATISTLPLLVEYFGKVPTFGLISNLLLLPLLVVAFQVCVVAITTFVGQVLLYPLDWISSLVVWGVEMVSKIPYSVISLTNGGIFNLFYYLGLVLCTRFIFVKRSYKFCVAGVLFAVYTIGFWV